ncbi:hypothetical protein Cocul_00875 [Corynebacterium oculi]|uniref:Uncharacterized protein n=1 Tax=Corynebacterium oculi TaxID=1544416 RepID=A0A0Q1ABQ1_9CORY|nr:hypothetical protein Cocul_00875 [Corynebacterium oculi]
MGALRAVDLPGEQVDVEQNTAQEEEVQAKGIVVHPSKLKLPVAATSRVAPGEDDPAVWLVGAHGGAGVSTLAHVLAPAGDAGMMWPSGERSMCCVLVCRSTAMGLEDAHDVLIQARNGLAGDVVVLGLVVVADAPGRTPKTLEQKIAVLSQITQKVWRVPYIDQWRGEMREDLPVWVPGDELPRKRRGRLPPGVVPPVVGEIGQEIFTSFQRVMRKVRM